MDIGPITMFTRMWNEQDLKRMYAGVCEEPNVEAWRDGGPGSSCSEFFY